MNIIPQSIEIFLHAISAILTPDALTDFGSKMVQMSTAGNTLLLSIIPGFLRQMDDDLAKDPKRKAEWKVVRIDKRELVTVLGVLHFERRYYCNRKTGEMAYLLDKYLATFHHSWFLEADG